MPVRRRIIVRSQWFSMHVGWRVGETRMLIGEPSLEEILSEPIIHLLMQADRVSIDELRTLLALVARQA